MQHEHYRHPPLTAAIIGGAPIRGGAGMPTAITTCSNANICTIHAKKRRNTIGMMSNVTEVARTQRGEIVRPKTSLCCCGTQYPLIHRFALVTSNDSHQESKRGTQNQDDGDACDADVVMVSSSVCTGSYSMAMGMSMWHQENIVIVHLSGVK